MSTCLLNIDYKKH